MSDQPIFQPQCPNGDPFYACDYGTRFLGCCANTTQDEACVRGCTSVEAASFDADFYSYVTQNDCDNILAKWYTCAHTSPPFLGCCGVNPCSGNGCPQDALVPAQLSTIDAQKAAFSTILIEKPSESQKQTGAIAGGAVGGLVIVVILICSILLYRRKRLQQQKAKSSSKKNGFGGN